jgi:hypothetical protein
LESPFATGADDTLATAGLEVVHSSFGVSAASVGTAYANLILFFSPEITVPASPERNVSLISFSVLVISSLPSVTFATSSAIAKLGIIMAMASSITRTR